MLFSMKCGDFAHPHLPRKDELRRLSLHTLHWLLGRPLRSIANSSRSVWEHCNTRCPRLHVSHAKISPVLLFMLLCMEFDFYHCRLQQVDLRPVILIRYFALREVVKRWLREEEPFIWISPFYRRLIPRPCYRSLSNSGALLPVHEFAKLEKTSKSPKSGPELKAARIPQNCL